MMNKVASLIIAFQKFSKTVSSVRMFSGRDRNHEVSSESTNCMKEGTTRQKNDVQLVKS